MILNNKRTCCQHIAGIGILPGLNEISDDDYKALKDHSVFADLLKNGAFKVEKNTTKAIKEIAVEINPQKTEELVKEIVVNKPVGSLNIKDLVGRKPKAEEI